MRWEYYREGAFFIYYSCRHAVASPVHRVYMTVTLFPNKYLLSSCRRHSVAQLNRPSTEFSESRTDTCRCLTT